MEAKPSVVVVGAGIAGLAAASCLTKSGKFAVTILEASNRYGGRIHTQKIGGKVIELGANWIHGKKGNPIYDLAHEAGILDKPCGNTAKETSKQRRKKEYKMSDGKTCSPYIVREVESVYGNLIMQACDKKAVEKFQNNSWISKTSVGEYLRKGFENYLKKSSEVDEQEDLTMKESVFERCKMRECNSSACSSLSDLNLVDFGEYQDLDGGDELIRSGYDEIPKLLFNQLEQNSVYHNHKVVHIEWNDKETNKSSKNSEEATFKVKVSCENGEHFFADHVVVTLPLGKAEHCKLFTPPLPNSKKSAIENLGFGTVNKIFLEFEEPFWDSQSYTLCSLWRKEDFRNASSSFPPWVYGLYSFTTAYENSKILICWMNGKRAMEMERASIDEITQNCLEVIRKFTGIDSLPRVTRSQRTQWYSSPLSQGSYSFVSTSSRGTDFDVMAAPVSCSKDDDSSASSLQILFAGEATHRLFYATVHGAYVSGIREAERLIIHYNMV